MSEIRILVQGITKDPEAFGAFMKSETDVLEQVEPGTLEMEVFVDPTSGSVVVHERYEDADAFLKHSESLMQSDRLQTFLKLFEIKRMTFLTPIEDGRVATIAAQLGAIRTGPVSRFSR
ncbi:MAG: putative quinol monooxygenase [Actinomycetota bacterium]